jgi:hypothetical protein
MPPRESVAQFFVSRPLEKFHKIEFFLFFPATQCTVTQNEITGILFLKMFLWTGSVHIISDGVRILRYFA